MKIIKFFIFLFCFSSSLSNQTFIFYDFNWRRFQLRIIRKKIDLVDDAIYLLLEKRQSLAKHSRYYKQTTSDPFREIKILSRLRKKGNQLDQNFVKQIWSFIFSESRRMQDLNLHQNNKNESSLSVPEYENKKSKKQNS